MGNITIDDIKQVYSEFYNKFNPLLLFKGQKTRAKDDRQIWIGSNGLNIVKTEEVADYFMTDVVPHTSNKIIKEKAIEFYEELKKDGYIKLFVDASLGNGDTKREGFILRPMILIKPQKEVIDVPTHWYLDWYVKCFSQEKSDNISNIR
ncbi:MAG: hypothetical protein WDA21_00865 [Bacilli bacterium]